MSEIASSVEAQCDEKDLQQRARQEEKLSLRQAKPSLVYFNRTRILYSRPASHRVGLASNRKVSMCLPLLYRQISCSLRSLLSKLWMPSFRNGETVERRRSEIDG